MVYNLSVLHGRRKKKKAFAVGAKELYEACSRICGSKGTLIILVIQTTIVVQCVSYIKKSNKFYLLFPVDLTEWELKIESDLKEEDQRYAYDSEDSEGTLFTHLFIISFTY